MPPVSVDQHIRKGLHFLSKANRAVIRASIPLEKLLGVAHPPGIPALLKLYSFSVAGAKYSGWLTTEQAKFLKNQTGNLQTFFSALERLLMHSSHGVVDAIAGLEYAVEAPRVSVKGAKARSVLLATKVGCCTVDGEPYGNCTETYCEQGLKGKWSQDPCNPRIRR
jgi:hypothetical protein